MGFKSFKYDIVKVQELLQSYINLIKNDFDYNMYIAGGGDCPYVWIEVDLSEPHATCFESDCVCFFIGDEYDGGDEYHGMFLWTKQDPDTHKSSEEVLEQKKTKKAVKEFMTRIIKREEKLKKQNI